MDTISWIIGGVFLFIFFFTWRSHKLIEKDLRKQIHRLRERENELLKELVSKKESEELNAQEEIEKIDILIKEYQETKMKGINHALAIWEQERVDAIEENLKDEELFLENFRAKAQEEIQELTKVLEDFKLKIEVKNKAILREKEILEKEDFYRIVLSKEDLDDILNLERVEPYLNNKEVLRKLIYSTYIRRPLGELVKRVLEGRKVSGVYKITFLKTGESYIGKSTDVGNRWHEHLKTVLGIGTVAVSSLHTKMKKEGIENFSFELIEEISRDKLSEREKYWIDFYGTINQLNMKSGG